MLGNLFLKLEAKENILMQEFYASGGDLKPVPVHTTLKTRLRRKTKFFREGWVPLSRTT